jgi:hypothetical protein
MKKFRKSRRNDAYALDVILGYGRRKLSKRQAEKIIGPQIRNMNDADIDNAIFAYEKKAAEEKAKLDKQRELVAQRMAKKKERLEKKIEKHEKERNLGTRYKKFMNQWAQSSANKKERKAQKFQNKLDKYISKTDRRIAKLRQNLAVQQQNAYKAKIAAAKRERQIVKHKGKQEKKIERMKKGRTSLVGTPLRKTIERLIKLNPWQVESQT